MKPYAHLDMQRRIYFDRRTLPPRADETAIIARENLRSRRIEQPTEAQLAAEIAYLEKANGL